MAESPEARLVRPAQVRAVALVQQPDQQIASVVTKRRLDAATLEQLEEALIIRRPRRRDLGRRWCRRWHRAGSARRSRTSRCARRWRPRWPRNSSRWQSPCRTARGSGRRSCWYAASTAPARRRPSASSPTRRSGLGSRWCWPPATPSARPRSSSCEVWGRRNGVPVIRGKEGADPAGLAFDALEQARAQGADLLLIDTAGRLQNKQGLMDELRKIIRVLKKVDPEAPHDTVLVLDATTGQNAHSQVEIFKDDGGLSGLIVTKLDGTAKGGVVVALARRFGLPIHAIGVGESDRRSALVRGRRVRARLARARTGAGRLSSARLRKGEGDAPKHCRDGAGCCGAGGGAGLFGLGLWPQRRRRSRRLQAARQVRPGRRAGHGRRRPDLRASRSARCSARSSIPQTYRAQVTFSVRNGIELPSDSSAAIVSSGLLGGKYLSLVPGGDDQPAQGRRRDHPDPVVGQPRGPDRPLHLRRPGGQSGQGSAVRTQGAGRARSLAGRAWRSAAVAPAHADGPVLANLVAVLRGLDKITARTTDHACAGRAPRSLRHAAHHRARLPETPPTEPPESAAFLEINVADPGSAPKTAFSGWMFASSPSLSALEHPVYDVWVVDCAEPVEPEPEPPAAPPAPAAPGRRRPTGRRRAGSRHGDGQRPAQPGPVGRRG